MECETPRVPPTVNFADDEASLTRVNNEPTRAEDCCNEKNSSRDSLSSLNKCSGCDDGRKGTDTDGNAISSLSTIPACGATKPSSSVVYTPSTTTCLKASDISVTTLEAEEGTDYIQITGSTAPMPKLEEESINGKYNSYSDVNTVSSITANSKMTRNSSAVDEGHDDNNAETPILDNREGSSVESFASKNLEEVQILERRSHSTPAIVEDKISSSGSGDSHDLSKGIPLAPVAIADVNGSEHVEECITSETQYRLHSKSKVHPRNLVQNLPITARATLCPPLSRSASVDQGRAEKPHEQKRFLDYTRYLMGLDLKAEMNPEGDSLEDAWTVATKRRGVYNLVQVPLKLERLLSFVMFICADEFLSSFTFLPLRALFALGKFLFFISSIPAQLFRRPSSQTRTQSNEQKLHTKARIANVIDILHFSILIFTSTILSLFDISWVYHNIRGQSVIKLYVVFNVMEIFDRLCSSFGVDILDSLGWTTASAVEFLSRGSSRAQTGGATRARAVQSVWLLSRVAFDFLFALVYTGLHAILLLVWVVTLNVAINTKNNALITLLIANNFVELKGSVFKSYKIQNMFQIACSDGVERFQLAIFLTIMLIYSTGKSTLLITWATIFSCEVLVDWIKHAFATKFNRIPHRVYPQFSMVICRDIAQTRTHSVVRSVGGSAVAKRIGFVSLPLAALVTRMATSSVLNLPLGAVFIICLTMVTTKVALSIGLMGHAHRRLKRAAEQHSELAKEEDEMESKWYQSLVNVGRYDLISKS